MNKKQKQELRLKNADQLIADLAKKEKELTETKFKFCQGQFKDVKTLAKKRNEIAIIKTIITEKKLELDTKNKKEKK